jgi:outer membrane protein assembly factor BamA
MTWPGLHGKEVILAFLFAASVFAAAALAQTPTPETSAKTDSANTQNTDETKKEKKGEWLVAPIPISSPAIGAGLEWAVGYMFPFNKKDKISPSSVIGVGGLFTNNGSRAIAVGGRLYFKEDKYRFTVAAGDAKINADIYGVGKLAGDRGLFLPLTATGSGLILEPLFIRLGKSFHLGARFQYRDLKLSLNREKLNLPEGVDPPQPIKDIIDEVAPDLFQQRTVAVGPRFQWDTRDDTYYPRKGFFLDSGIDLFAKAIGSKFTYQYYKVAFNKYSSLSKHQVIAVRGMGCAAAGDRVPIYDLCLFGNSNDLRGYSAGRYQDRRMFATQAEYRLNLPSDKFLGRFGVVAFGGFGAVGRRFSDIEWGDLLPAGGGGIRFRLTKKDHVNFRADYGIGRVGHTFTMGVGEAF